MRLIGRLSGPLVVTALVCVNPDSARAQSGSAVAEPAQSAGALSGSVTDAKAGAALPDAEVLLSGTATSVRTGAQGEFRITNVPAGTYEVRVRKVGYLELTDSITMPASGDVQRKFALRQVTTLAPVEVTADPTMAEFEENRRTGLGKFLTRAELATMEHRQLSDILNQIGVRSMRYGPHAWPVSRTIRAMRSIRGRCAMLEGFSVPERDRNNAKKNPGCGVCASQVWLDDMLMYRGDEGEVVPDINQFVALGLEGVEYYASPSQTPMKYSRLGSACGVLVLHSRRPGQREAKP